MLDRETSAAAALSQVCDPVFMRQILCGRSGAFGPDARPDGAVGLDLLAGSRLGVEAMIGLAAREEERARSLGISVLTPADDDYPALLREIADPPPALYSRGALAPDDEVRVAIVGARRSTRHGLGAAELIASELGERGVAVVSGLARGIDAAAHQGALEAGARTIAVLGSGLERLYPSEHRALAERIAAQGAVVSEYPLDTAPLPHLFPRRNRVISGLSAATVVVEAGRGSGALVTARFALDQDRELFAVPGTILGEACIGSNGLLVEGSAHVATAGCDVVRELPAVYRLRLGLPASPLEERGAGNVQGGAAPDESESGLGPDAADILARLSFAEPLGVDALAEASGIRTSALLAALAQLELRGLAVTLPGGRIARARPERAR